MSSWGNKDAAANAPYWAVNASLAKAAPASIHAAPTAANVAFLYANTTPSAYITNETIGLYMVDSGEEHAGGDKVVDVSIINGGTGYLEVPNVNFSGGGGSSAAATASIAGGTVTKILVTNTGSSYETIPNVYVDVPRRTIATSAVNTSSNTITYNTHGIETGEQIKYYNGGGTTMAGLSDSTIYYAIKVNANSFKVASSKANALAGTDIDITGTGNNAQFFDLHDKVTATAIADKGLGQGGTANSGWTHAVHTGWNLKTVGTGGRAGRVQWETLVAISNVATDGSDDIALPD